MRKAFNTIDETVQAFLNGKEEGRNKGGNLWFRREGDSTVLYSYSTAIAAILDKYPNGLFLSWYNYSHTTSRHKGAIYRHTHREIISATVICSDLESMVSYQLANTHDVATSPHRKLTRAENRHDLTAMYYCLNRLLNIDKQIKDNILNTHSDEWVRIQQAVKQAEQIQSDRDKQKKH